MAVRLKLDDLTDEHKKIIRKILCMQPKQSGFMMKNRYSVAKDPVMMYYIDKPNNEIVLPYTFGNSLFQRHFNSSLTYPKATYNFINTTLRPHQVPIVTQAMEHLNDKGTTTIGAPPGSGKTLMSAYIGSKTDGLVLVVSPLKLVQRGWVESFDKYTDAKVWNNDGKTPCPEYCNVILTMSGMFLKIPKQILAMVKTLVIDEAHMFCTPERIHCLLGISPRYVIACTATPTRADGMETMIQSVCGTHGIYIKPTKKYTVYKLLTGIDVEIQKNKAGTSDWPRLVRELCESKKRNNIILDIAKRNPTFKIMILTWNRNHAFYLKDMLCENNISCDVLAGTKSSYKDSRVLVGTLSKLGVGFDEGVTCTDWNGIRLNMMFLVGSTKNTQSLCQFVGRIFRSEHPVIIDFVDDNNICKRHWNARRKWYDDPEQNGEIFTVNYDPNYDNKPTNEMDKNKIMSVHQTVLDKVKNKTKTTTKTKPNQTKPTKYIYVSHQDTIYRYSPGGLRLGKVTSISNEKIYKYEGLLTDKNLMLKVLNSPFYYN